MGRYRIHRESTRENNIGLDAHEDNTYHKFTKEWGVPEPKSETDNSSMKSRKNRTGTPMLQMTKEIGSNTH